MYTLLHVNYFANGHLRQCVHSGSYSVAYLFMSVLDLSCIQVKICFQTRVVVRQRLDISGRRSMYRQSAGIFLTVFVLGMLFSCVF